MRFRVNNNQDAFEAVVEQLKHQQGRAVVGVSRCVYLDEATEQRCAVGGLIEVRPSERAKLASVVGDVSGLLCDCPELDLGDISEQLLWVLQAIHDERTNWDGRGRFVGWADLAECAHVFDLDVQSLPD